MELVKTYTAEDEQFLRRVTPPEEDRQQLTARLWSRGSYRWFRSANGDGALATSAAIVGGF